MEKLMHYRCLQKQQFEDPPYKLVPLRHQDILLIKEWRNAQIDILRQNEPLTDAMQESYYQNIVIPTFSAKEPEQILLSYLHEGQCIGYGALVRMDWSARQAEVSFLVNTARAKDRQLYKSDFTAYLNLIKQVAFDALHFHRLYAETYDFRPQHIAILESQGFVLEERLVNHAQKKGKVYDSLIHGCVAK